MRLATVLLGAALAAGCGKEVGRVSLSSAHEGESKIDLKAGEVAFWTDIDIEWEGNVTARYEIDLEQNGSKVATTTCNPLGPLKVKLGWVETHLSGRHSRRGRGKMDCAVQLEKGGPTVVHTKLSLSSQPASLKLAKADLVLKQ
jgi:hypothetical protein